ncbi:MAG: GH1 family beta-glucosidase [Roseiflexaceae bacterium]
MRFPDGFVWGVAAAAYQIEGGAQADGRGESVWDRFCRRPGAIWEGHTGDVACDHYHRYREDVGLMEMLGIQAYRFSIGWPRVLPNGVGAVNQAGLDFYDRLVDRLLEAGITPYATLFHWDFPYALYCRGGWLNPDSPQWFAEYAEAVVRRLGDRVKHWMPINEPAVVMILGHYQGTHAPGDKLQLSQVLQINHHMLLAHGRAVQAIRAACPASVVGVAPSSAVGVPISDRPADQEAARCYSFSVSPADLWSNVTWLDPVFLGRYSEQMQTALAPHMPQVGPGDMELIAQPLDFLGVNIYSAALIRATADGRPEIVTPAAGHPTTNFGWYVIPEALYWGPRFLHERYGAPVVITENGMACADWRAGDGRVRDPQRIDFLQRYLSELGRAIADGVDVRGYFQWSIMDNFEWHEGYRQRFGLIHVDYATQRRTPKDSAYWYRDLIRSNGAVLGLEA